MFSESSASTNFDQIVPNPEEIPIDWTPERGYANESIRQKAIPRPAPGKTAQCLNGTIGTMGLWFFLLLEIPYFEIIRCWKSPGIVCDLECQYIRLLLFIGRKCWLQTFTTQSNRSAPNLWLRDISQHWQRNSNRGYSENNDLILSGSKVAHWTKKVSDAKSSNKAQY